MLTLDVFIMTKGNGKFDTLVTSQLILAYSVLTALRE